ncbi:tetraspanin family protein (macronuclear) [Tetrahymena thermophila SB210]|uniref:Tetraspanin family protein n=1 Tax=Tetrahymena thermophila (strain SB210) TaxID=312017 RepID=Q22W66_TETTS|nr:tetraspanin family protein [Tetrahymena thermophila SB210]EAR89551.2 tetraspanin family protein [Tetrahymena thermophila SB210]|eukprot:XP_001009796.2 tetraspanin family protein [Tetrahymena thermophila SB210]
MSVCLNFLKGYLVLGCIFNIGLGIGAFVAAAYLNNLNQSFLVNGGVSAGKKYGVIGLFALGGVCCLIGLLGIIAFWKRIKCFQFLFILFNTLFLVIFAAVLAGLIYSQPFLNKLKNQSCDQITELKEADDLFTRQMKPYFCKLQTSSVCPCYVTDKSKWSSVDTSQIVFQPSSSSKDVKAVTECSYVSNQIQNSQTEIDLLKAVEEQFNCTGICSSDVIYYFSDINRGPPSSTSGCYKPLKDLLLKIIGGVFIFVVISTVFSFLNVLFGFVNCCCAKYDTPQNQNQDQNAQNQQDISSIQMSVRKPLNPQPQAQQSGYNLQNIAAHIPINQQNINAVQKNVGSAFNQLNHYLPQISHNKQNKLF